MFILAALVLLARDAGFDYVLGAFCAGLLVGIAIDSPEGEPVRLRLEGIGFGLLIPIYFVVTGMNFDLDSLLSPEGLGLAALFLALLIVVRGASTLLWLRDLDRRRTVALALLSATGLPLIVAIVGLGADRGAISSQVGASLIGAGMISVLVLPLLAIRIVGRQRRQRPADARISSTERTLAGWSRPSPDTVSSPEEEGMQMTLITGSWNRPPTPVSSPAAPVRERRGR